MLADFSDAKLAARTKRAVRAAARPYRKAMPKAAPRIVRKLRPARESEHRNPFFHVEVTPANNLWQMFEHGRRAGYSIPKVARSRSAQGYLHKVLAGYEFGPVRGPIQGGAMAPRPFVQRVFEANRETAMAAARAKLMEPAKGAA